MCSIRDQGLRTILRQDHDIKDARIDTVGQGKINDAVFARKGDSRFGAFGCEDAQAGTFPASKDDSACFHKIRRG